MNLQATRILIVEDEPAHAEAVARSLESIAGLELRHMASLREFRSEGEAWHPDITLMDLNLPDGRATEILTGYTDSRPFPIIVMTSFGSEGTAVEALRAGALDYLVKSHETFHSLPLTVERWLREWQVRVEGKRMHQELKASEAKYRSLAESSTDFIMRFDLEGRHTYMNQAALKMLGQTTEGVLGKTHHELGFPEELCRFWQQKIATVFQAGQPLQTEFTFLSSEGRVTHDWHLTPEFDANGIVFSVLGISRDITERKKVEESLRTVYTSMEQSPGSIIITDCDGAIQFVNPAFSRVTGYSADEALGQNPRILQSGRHSQEFYREMWETLLAGRVWSGEIQNRRKNGEIFTESASISAVRNDSGAITGYVAVKDDITERKQVEAAMRRSEVNHQALVHNLKVGVVVHGPDTAILQSNQEASTLLGLSRDQIQGRAATDPAWCFIREDGSPLPVEEHPVSQVIASRHPIKNMILGIVQTAQASPAWVQVNAYPEIDDREHVQRVVMTFVDITQHKLTEQTQAFLLKCGTPASGEDYFAELARYLADTLKLDYVCIDLLEGDGLSAQTVAIYNQGLFESNVRYALKDTPCGEVVDQRVCCIPREVQRLFPRDAALQELKAESYLGTTLWDSKGIAIGLIAVIGQRPLDHTEHAQALLRQVGPSAAAELERRLAKAVLLETELRQRTMIAGISDVIGILDTDGTNRYKSPNIEKYFGWNPDEVVGLSAFENVHPDDRPGTQEVFARLMSHPQITVTAECRYQCKDGSYKPIEFTASNLIDDPSIQGILLNYRDITERKHVEKSLQMSEQMFRDMTQNVPGVLYQLRIRADGTSYFSFFSERASSLFGFSDAPDWNMVARIPEEDQEGFLASITHAIATRSPWEYEGRILGNNGEVRWFQGNSLPSELGDELVYNGILQDISDSKFAEEKQRTLEAQLHQAQKMESLGSLAGGVAHDMNNVLGAILGLATANVAAQPVGSHTRQAFETIIKAAERGGKMVRSLLGFARQTTAETFELNMNEVLKDEIRLLENTTLAKVHIKLDLADDLRPMLGDVSALANALMNLCVNAVDAMPENGTLTIRTRNVDSDWIELQVEDTGTGMPKEVLARAMDPFYTTKGQGKGTGLGLSLVYSTVQAHQGQIELQSEVGQGTSVRLRFPAFEQVFSVVVQEKGQIAESPTGDLKVLLIDDDELIQAAVGMMLEALGHSVSSAHCGEEALAQLEAGLPVDLVILDMNMPGLGGSGTLPRLRAMRPSVPVLLSTGKADQMALDLVASDPHTTLLSKPFAVEEMKTKVQAVVRRT